MTDGLGGASFAARGSKSEEEATMTTDPYAKLEAELRNAQDQWEKRLTAIRKDRRRMSAPLDRNLDDQAIQRENDDALDALDERGRSEVLAIDAALARIAAGTYGQCVGCHETISIERLTAYPTADRCMVCARSESAA